jgi:hypothetical protein
MSFPESREEENFRHEETVLSDFNPGNLSNTQGAFPRVHHAAKPTRLNFLRDFGSSQGHFRISGIFRDISGFPGSIFRDFRDLQI